MNGVTPVIHFDRNATDTWLGKSFVELYEETEALRKAVKKATNFYWDNTHFYITNIFGKPAIQIQFWQNNISLWNNFNGCGLKTIISKTGIITSDMINYLNEAVSKVTEGFTQCGKCDEWVNEHKKHSYAGAVCLGCFDPKVHKGPDTRGE